MNLEGVTKVSIADNPRVIDPSGTCKHPRNQTLSDEQGRFCTKCGLQLSTTASSTFETAERFVGRAPDEAVVMENNVGTVPGPERAKQVMSALNQDPRTYNGLRFEEAKVRLLNEWMMSGDPTDRLVSVILKHTIKGIEAKRCINIPPGSIDAIARLCKAGVKRAEHRKRLAKWEIEAIVHRIFEKEGF